MKIQLVFGSVDICRSLAWEEILFGRKSGAGHQSTIHSHRNAAFCFFLIALLLRVELLFSSFFIHLCICQDRAIMTIIFSALVIVEKNWLGSFSSVDLVYWVWLVFCEFFYLACFG